MTPTGILQLIVFMVALIGLSKPLGDYMARVYEGKARLAGKVLGPVERLVYRACGVDPAVATWLGLLSPLVAVHAISGAHNDALLAGLVVAALAVAAGTATKIRDLGTKPSPRRHSGSKISNLAGAGERLELVHRATNRGIYATGAVRAAGWLVGRSPGLYGMKEVLGL